MPFGRSTVHGNTFTASIEKHLVLRPSLQRTCLSSYVVKRHRVGKWSSGWALNIVWDFSSVRIWKSSWSYLGTHKQWLTFSISIGKTNFAWLFSGYMGSLFCGHPSIHPSSVRQAGGYPTWLWLFERRCVLVTSCEAARQPFDNRAARSQNVHIKKRKKEPSKTVFFVRTTDTVRPMFQRILQKKAITIVTMAAVWLKLM